jgi:transposase
LREVFNALRWLARAGAPWRLLPHDFPPWQTVYQQFRRWNDAGCFEAMVSDMRSIIRVGDGRRGQPSAVILDGRTLQSSWAPRKTPACLPLVKLRHPESCRSLQR